MKGKYTYVTPKLHTYVFGGTYLDTVNVFITISSGTPRILNHPTDKEFHVEKVGSQASPRGTDFLPFFHKCQHQAEYLLYCKLI